jgi:uncharacterized Tic20 family protein
VADASASYGVPAGEASQSATDWNQVPAADPYAQSPSQPGSFASPVADPYSQPSASVGDPYAQTSAPPADPYAAQASYGAPADPYAQPQPGYGMPDPGAQQPYAQPGYGDPSAQQYPQAAAPQYQQPGYPMAVGAEPPVPHGTAVPRNADDLTWGTAAHWSPIVIGFIGPLLTLVLKGNESQFVKQNSNEALNFELTLLIGYVVSVILMFVGIGFITYPLIWVLGLIFHIMGAIESNKGKVYKYPFSIKFLK